MKDYIGQELKVGDRVVHGVGGRYGGLSGPYFVHSFSPKQVRLANAMEQPRHSKIVPSGNLVKVPQ